MTELRNFPKLSVLLVCYNQERYIKRAIESILAQDVPMDRLEVIVADDCSTDKTLEIAIRILGQVSDLAIRVLPTAANLGITRNYDRGFSACQGEYIAILEGDDYWCSPRKLESQVLFLERNLACSACCVNHFLYDEERSDFTLRTQEIQGYSFFNARQVILENPASNFSNMVYRTSAIRDLPPGLFDLRAYDWMVNICIARLGPIGYLHQPMSVYRIHPDGAWSSLSKADQISQQIVSIRSYDEFTGRIFHQEFESLLAELCKEKFIPEMVYRSGWLRLINILRAFVPPIVGKAVQMIIPPAIPIIFRKIFRRVS